MRRNDLSESTYDSSPRQSTRGGSAAAVDLSPLDELLRDFDKEEDTKAAVASIDNEAQSNTADITSVKEVDDRKTDVKSSFKQEDTAEEDADKARARLEYPRPDTSLEIEKDRDEWLRSMEFHTWEESAANGSLQVFHRQRYFQIIISKICVLNYFSSPYSFGVSK